ncbi:hypothetical protein [Colwellia psychrerythraea]|uniref:Uncharacterized protein n=1 Tax=Colwellia psychrerythraea TaxID=28229 RepID=A0A099KWG9_COLPS|nr:hypothetical protein [Colwellia psychrerythraea]KGJ95079.1 hypothetical protein GAB14E_1861 [Colwellia psychrerythraea]
MLKNNKITTAIRVAMMFGAGTAVTVSAVDSEEKNASVERIQATGIRMSHTDMALALPAAWYNSEGILHVSTVISKMLLNSQDSWEASAGASWVRNLSKGSCELGANRTLTLINGKRTAPYGLARY